MGCSGNNATPPGPAIAPGAGDVDPRRVAEALVDRFGEGGVDPRVRALVPGFDGPFFQAGLAGYSDAAMRLIARRHGCPFCVTEALLDRTLLAGGRGFAKADLGELEDNVPGGEEDHPLAGQIMGSDPREMAAAALKMVEQGARADREYRRMAYPDGVLPTGQLHGPGGEQVGIPKDQRAKIRPQDTEPGVIAGTGLRNMSGGVAFAQEHASTFEVIDVNLACPVKKIDRKARGGHWLAEPRGAIAILEAVREAVPARVHCTVKLRRAYDDSAEMAANFERILDAACDMGYAWATVHARTVAQKYVGPSRWDVMREIVRRRPERVIFGSGDVWQAADIFRMIAYTGVSAVSVARGCIGNPWIFRQTRDLLAGCEPAPPTLEEQRAVLLEHFDLALAANRRMRRAEEFTARTMRKFGIRFAQHHPDAEAVRRRMIAVSSLEDWRGVVGEMYGERVEAM